MVYFCKFVFTCILGGGGGVAWGLKHKAHALDNRVNLNSVGGSTSKIIVKA